MMIIAFGALSPPISEQLKGKIPQKSLKPFDQDAKALVRLYIRGIVTDSEVDKARIRLVKAIEKEYKAQPPQEPSDE